MIYPWKLNYWQTGEWQVVNERLKDMEKAHVRYNPRRVDLFRSLSALPLSSVRVAIIGQDPYPQSQYATGQAFSIPRDIETTSFPPTLNTILKEYCSDLHYPLPLCGDLSEWGRRGVLLWNAVPSCRAGESLSHDWDEYSFLTKEIITKLSDKGGVVFAFLGSVARRYVSDVDPTKNAVVVTSHPSPRGQLHSKVPFTGSRLFSTINDKLADLGQTTIDWRLPDAKGDPAPSERGAQRSGLVDPQATATR